MVAHSLDSHKNILYDWKKLQVYYIFYVNQCNKKLSMQYNMKAKYIWHMEVLTMSYNYIDFPWLA